ncbi:unnamed protein product [Heligmosomoides polygyrus]|uniref:ACT domain-containing protein n=1 Tax=Heligmosomoides polygyrus TaxID=6339 RepID=A0A183GSM9_HELPZ|nr:unnamed protein product [Heligmosomoides polygyrus]
MKSQMAFDSEKALEACVAQSTRRTAKGSVKEILTYLAERLGGIPFLNISVKSDLDLFEVLGNVEQERALGTFMSSWVSVDYKNVERNALYISQVSM